jgi:biopolymer transport protein ExbB
MQIIEFVVKGGFVMWLLVPMAVVTVALIVERLIAYKQEGSTAPGLLEEVRGLVRAGRESDALRLCKDRGGPVAAALATVLEERNQPVDYIERRYSEVLNGAYLRLDRFLPVLQVFTQVAPLAGLLGTIIGMIRVFVEFQNAQAAGGSQGVLSGVAEALYATATGIAVATVSFAAYGYFIARRDNIIAEAENAADSLINELLGTGRVAPATLASDRVSNAPAASVAR